MSENFRLYNNDTLDKHTTGLVQDSLDELVSLLVHNATYVIHCELLSFLSNDMVMIHTTIEEHHRQPVPVIYIWTEAGLHLSIDCSVLYLPSRTTLVNYERNLSWYHVEVNCSGKLRSWSGPMGEEEENESSLKRKEQ